MIMGGIGLPLNVCRIVGKRLLPAGIFTALDGIAHIDAENKVVFNDFRT